MKLLTCSCQAVILPHESYKRLIVLVDLTILKSLKKLYLKSSNVSSFLLHIRIFPTKFNKALLHSIYSIIMKMLMMRLHILLLSLALVAFHDHNNAAVEGIAVAELRKLAAKNNVTCLLVFGDSSVDPGNNNHLSTTNKANYLPYGMDLSNSQPTGRFSNGKLATDFVGN